MVSFIIINYNTYYYTKQAIKSILQHVKHTEYEIILVDNASSDQSITQLKCDCGNIIHSNKAANLKSKLAKHVAAL